MKTKSKTKKKKYWYAIETTACVLCGREIVYRWRVYSKKEAVREYHEDACPEHFM